MIVFELKCYHPEEGDLGKGYEMKPTNLLEFNRISYKCVKCGKEVILIMTIGGE